MKLDALLQSLDATIDENIAKQLAAIDIQELALHSAAIQPYFAYFAISGVQDNNIQYIAQALSRGAKLIVYSQSSHASQDSFLGERQKAGALFFYQSCWFLAVENVRSSLALAASAFWPLQPKHIVAVTGTSGKTSVASFTNQLWQLLHYNAASIGTLGVSRKLSLNKQTLTTPDAINLHKILQALALENISHVIMEASSHGIEQARLDQVRLSAAAFTNLGRDHLDYHIDIENYFLAKMALFERILPKGRPVILFADDKYSDKVFKHISKHQKNIFTIGTKGDFIQIKNIAQTKQGQLVELIIDGNEHRFNFPLQGAFQLYNALVALAIVIVEGAAIIDALAAMARLSAVAGRMQLIGKNNSGALIYLDYAHKPEALLQILQEARSLNSGKIILVFGCGGDRDKGKRAIMGEIAQTYSDITIVTDDNPRSEVPKEIRSQIMQTANAAIEIPDRAAAIAHAIAMAEAEDIILVAGKGHETGQIVGGKVLPFSDERVIMQCLKNQE